MSGFFSCGPLGSYSSWIRHLAVTWAWPDLWGCTGAMLGVSDVVASTGVTSGTAGVCGFELQVLQVQRAEAAAVVQTWWAQAVVQKCEVWQESAVWLL